MGWSAPFAPWVVESWRQHLENIGYTPEVHKSKVDHYLTCCKIANDQSLSVSERTKKIKELGRRVIS